MNNQFTDDLWRYTEFQILKLRSETASLLAEINILANYLGMEEDEKDKANLFIE